MPGLRVTQTPTTASAGPGHMRRRNSLPALSSDQLNRLSANAQKTRPASKGSVKSLPDTSSTRKTDKSALDRVKNSSIKSLKSPDKLYTESDSNKSVENNDDYVNGNSNSKEENDLLSLGNNFPMLQTKRQPNKSNAVFIFRFEEDDDKSTSTTTSSSTSQSSPQEIENPFLGQDLRQTWPQSSLDDLNVQNLANSVRYNTLGFCGFKHRQLRQCGKVHPTMSPVLELKTPTDDTEDFSDDDTSIMSGSDVWSVRGRDIDRRQGLGRINANSNLMLRSDPDPNLSHTLQSALSLSPRRASSGKRNLSSMKKTASRSQDTSTPPRRSIRRGSLDSTVGQIFSSLNSPSSSTVSTSSSKHSKSSLSSSSSSSLSSSSSSSSSNKLAPPDNRSQTKPKSPILQSRLLGRRRSLSALPDLVGVRGNDSTKR